MMSLREKEEAEAAANTSTTPPPPPPPPAVASSSRQWSSSGLKNPRIVRVSRTFGGKDRHSKVCTIKGLRDRRIRLSVPTAIQLYDLQDRLGLGQPSKVIDWLIDNTKNDIDKLPPLPPIPGTFPHFHQPSSQGYGNYGMSSFIDANLLSSRREGGGFDVNEDPSSIVGNRFKYWDTSSMMMRSSKQKEIDDDDDDDEIGEGSNSNNNGNNNSSSQVFAQNFFPIASGGHGNATILPPSTFLSNHPMYNNNYNSSYHWDQSHLALTQLGGLGLSSQNDPQGHTSGNSSSVPPSQLSGSQLFLSHPSLFPPQVASYMSTTHHHHPQLDNDIRQFGPSHLSNNNNNNNSPFNYSPLYTSRDSSALGLRPFPFSMSHQDHKNIDDSWKEGSSRND